MTQLYYSGAYTQRNLSSFKDKVPLAQKSYALFDIVAVGENIFKIFL